MHLQLIQRVSVIDVVRALSDDMNTTVVGEEHND